MPNQITNPPNTYDFGLNFNYAVWLPGTIISLVNVPWNNDYRDIVRFASKSALNAYIDSRETEGSRIEKMSYVKPNTPVRVSMPINRAMGFNYLRASNPLQPIPGNDNLKAYYYFITDVRYLSPNTTELVLQLDVWQTFGYDVVFGTAYVERGHIGIANENQFNNYGRDYLTVPEGFDLGNEYRVIAKRKDDIMGLVENGGVVTTDTDVLVVSTTDLTADPGTVSDPKLVTAQGGFIELGISGADVYVSDHQRFLSFLDGAKETPWVTQGIISVTLMPKITRYIPEFVYATEGLTKISAYFARPKTHNLFSNWRDSTEISNAIEPRYRPLKKLWTFPYMGIEITCFTGNTVSLKPEVWNDANAQVMERITYTPPNQRIDFTPRKYNSDGRTPENMGNVSNAIADALQWREKGDDFGDYLDITIGITNLPRVPIVNNGQLSYLASNNSTLNYQRSSAGWAEQRALRAASTGYDQASKGLDTARALNQIGVNADIAQTGNVNRTQVAQTVTSVSANAAGSIAKGAIGGSLAGPQGALTGAGVAALGAGIDAAGNLINVGIQTAANDEALSIRNAAAAGNLAAQQGQGSYIRDTNKSLADWAARGDYANEIAGINARVQDSAMIQPSVSGMFGGESINLANATVEFSIRWKLIDKATIKRVGEFWLRYGYAINTAMRNLPADMMVMSHFTYWKMTETYLTSAPMPESFKQAIRGIFEKGVTVWRNPADIGTLDYALNQPIEGISY